VVHGGAQCHQTGADDRQDAHLIWVSAKCTSLSSLFFSRRPLKQAKKTPPTPAPQNSQSLIASPRLSHLGLGLGFGFGFGFGFGCWCWMATARGGGSSSRTPKCFFNQPTTSGLQARARHFVFECPLCSPTAFMPAPQVDAPCPRLPAACDCTGRTAVLLRGILCIDPFGPSEPPVYGLRPAASVYGLHPAASV
jgi:hypothetical protein